jgi:hypothetical protein
MSDESELDAQVEHILNLCPPRAPGGRFTVVCPVYNRRRTLSRALDSLLAQTYGDWLCLILDDGSTDGTSRIGEYYARGDSRFLYVRFEENRGGVTMNEIGMRVACEVGDFWSRLGSDDWFEPHKLMADHVTLGRNETPACFGPFRCTRETLLDRILFRWRTGFLRRSKVMDMSVVDAAIRSGRLQGAPADARGMLLSRQFAMSWVNVAVRTDVLRKVRDRFGGFCDRQSRNMEDFHCNARIASVSSIAWRGLERDRKTVVIGAQTWDEAGGEEEFLHDGTWRAASDGASSNLDQCASDTRITLAAIEADFAKYPPEQCPAVGVRVVQL